MPLEEIERWLHTIESENRQPLLHEALELLDLVGVSSIPWRMSRSLEQARDAVETMGFPVALKAVAPSLLHKSDRGAIALNVADKAGLEAQWRQLRDLSADVTGIVVQKMASARRELIIGAKRDVSFGPIVLAGFGGVMVEVLRDVRMRLAPIDRKTALDMLGELAGSRLLGRFRGMEAADLPAAARILERVSHLMLHFPVIQELDLNPVALDDAGNGAVALDARVLLGR